MSQEELKKLIVVDDDPGIITVVKYCLEDFGEVEVKLLNSGQQLLDIAPEFSPDMIVLDVMMPEMDGLETFQKLKQMPQLAKIPVVFLTAKVQESEIKHYLEIGAFDVMQKPFDPMKLKDQILEIWKQT